MGWLSSGFSTVLVIFSGCVFLAEILHKWDSVFLAVRIHIKTFWEQIPIAQPRISGQQNENVREEKDRTQARSALWLWPLLRAGLGARAACSVAFPGRHPPPLLQLLWFLWAPHDHVLQTQPSFSRPSIFNWCAARIFKTFNAWLFCQGPWPLFL